MEWPTLVWRCAITGGTAPLADAFASVYYVELDEHRVGLVARPSFEACAKGGGGFVILERREILVF